MIGKEQITYLEPSQHPLHYDRFVMLMMILDATDQDSCNNSIGHNTTEATTYTYTYNIIIMMHGLVGFLRETILHLNKT